jgi:AraC-like DNA-binding protein
VSPRRAYTDAEVEAAVQALSDPGRLEEAQRIVGASAPQLQRIFNQALEEADWFGSAHLEQVRQAAFTEDPHEREVAVRTLVAEETRVSMLIGVAVGMELADLLEHPEEDQ